MDVVVGRCAVCGDALAGCPLARCGACETAIHQRCAEFLGGCARYACPEAATSRGRMRRYLRERMRHDLALEAFAVALFGLSAWLVQSWIVLLAASIHVPAVARLVSRMARLSSEAGDPYLVDMLRAYPPVVGDESAPRHGVFVSSLRQSIRLGIAIVALLTLAFPLLALALGLAAAVPVWRAAVVVTAVVCIMFGGIFGGALAVFELLAGTRAGQPRWAPLADAWKDEIEAWSRPVAQLEDEKPAGDA